MAQRNMAFYERPIWVNCPACGRINEKDVEFIDIAEDIQGRDVLTFRCPKCREVRKSLRLG